MSPERVDEDSLSSSTRSSADSFARFYRSHERYLRNSMRATVRDDATVDDILAEAMMLMWVRWKDIGGPGDESANFPRMRSYALKVVFYKSRELYRKPVRNFPLSELDLDASIFSSSDDVSAGIETEETLEVISKLPSGQRHALAMKILGFNDSEVAARLGVEEGTVRSHLALARRKISNYLKPSGSRRVGAL